MCVSKMEDKVSELLAMMGDKSMSLNDLNVLIQKKQLEHARKQLVIAKGRDPAPEDAKRAEVSPDPFCLVFVGHRTFVLDQKLIKTAAKGSVFDKQLEQYPDRTIFYFPDKNPDMFAYICQLLKGVTTILKILKQYPSDTFRTALQFYGLDSYLEPKIITEPVSLEPYIRSIQSSNWIHRSFEPDYLNTHGGPYQTLYAIVNFHNSWVVLTSASLKVFNSDGTRPITENDFNVAILVPKEVCASEQSFNETHPDVTVPDADKWVKYAGLSCHRRLDTAELSFAVKDIACATTKLMVVYYPTGSNNGFSLRTGAMTLNGMVAFRV